MIMAKDKKKILIVDDNPSIRSFLKVPLSSEYDISEASTAEEAKEQYSQQEPDLIILDLGLPDEDGFEVLYMIREENNDMDTKVVILTVRDDGVSRDKAAKLKADEYVTKPFRFGDVYEIISDLTH